MQYIKWYRYHSLSGTNTTHQIGTNTTLRTVPKYIYHSSSGTDTTFQVVPITTLEMVLILYIKWYTDTTFQMPLEEWYRYHLKEWYRYHLIKGIDTTLQVGSVPL